MIYSPIIYKDEVIVGGIYDNRFLIKKTKSLASYNLKPQIPYPGAKEMLLVDSEDVDVSKELIITAFRDIINKD